MAYRSVEALSVEQVVELAARLWPSAEPGQDRLVKLSDVALEQLPDLGAFSLGHFEVGGELAASAEPWTQFEQMLSHPLATSACVIVGADFNERGSEQTDRNYDVVKLRSKKGAIALLYGALGSRVAKDRAHAQSFLSELIAIAELPLHVRGDSSGYVLEERAAGVLKLMVSRLGRNPSSFWCALPAVAVSAAVAKLRRVLDALAARRLQYHWSVMAGPEQGLAAAYAALLAPPFHAQRFSLSAQLVVEDLSKLDALIPLCVEETVLTPLGVVELAPPARAVLSLATGADGHRLQVSLSDDDHLTEAQHRIGIDLPDLV